MVIDRSILVGAGAGVVGLVLGLVIGMAGRSELEARATAQDKLDQGVSALSASVSALDARLGAIDGRIGAIEGAVAGLRDTSAGGLEDLGRRLEGVGSSVGEAASTVGAEVSDAVSGELSRLRSELAALMDRAAAGAALLADPGDAPGSAEAEAAGGGEAIAVGQTASFGDGAARVFLSAADPAAGTARVAVNGQRMSVLALRAPVDVGGCRLTLTGFAEGGATIAGDCGEADAAGAGAAPQGSGVGVAVPLGAVGELGDGKVKLFLSGVDAAAGTARVAINGTRLSTLAMEEPVDVDGCPVQLTGIADGGATFDAGC